MHPEEQRELAASKHPQSSIDTRVTGWLEHFSQATSRRGFLAKCGSTLLGAVGVTVIAAAPVNRLIPEAAASSCGTSYNLCGMYGRPCHCCGATNSTCPGTSGCATSYWSACCKAPDNFGDIIRYYDCCGGTNISCVSSCFCYNRSPVDAWCNCSPYRCTRVQYAGSC